MQENVNITSGKQYMLSAIRRKPLDRIPTTVLIGPYCAPMAGYSVREILKDAQKSAQAHLAFYNRFHPDSLIVYNDIYLELEAMGCALDFPENSISHPKRPLREDKKSLADLKIPDPQKIDVYFASVGAPTREMILKSADDLRQKGYVVESDFMNRSIKSQMKYVWT